MDQEQLFDVTIIEEARRGFIPLFTEGLFRQRNREIVIKSTKMRLLTIGP
ncbi:hypothetical protein [Paenibacillus sp. MSJ-34]|nr:hypothetical protein [Paenibacillus sp. MSJ-34]MBU5440639.1 hypothetical protein [Paenibacillus sp. MSJ-34]